MNLKELRVKNKLTQAEFGSALGVSGKSIYLIEAGKMKLSKKLSARIAEVYGEVIEPAERKTRKPRAKKPAAEAVVEAAAPVVEVKAKRPRKRASAPAFVIQSPYGGEITPEEISARIGEADTVYIRVDQNKAYWVRGEETGDIDLW